MVSRILSLALGAALAALAVLTWRPELYGAGAPQVDLGLYNPYRDMVAMTLGVMGALIVIAAIVRRSSRRQATSAPMSFETDATDSDPLPAFGSEGRAPQPLW